MLSFVGVVLCYVSYDTGATGMLISGISIFLVFNIIAIYFFKKSGISGKICRREGIVVSLIGILFAGLWYLTDSKPLLAIGIVMVLMGVALFQTADEI